jgi:hypothetical protein
MYIDKLPLTLPIGTIIALNAVSQPVVSITKSIIFEK